MSGQECFQLLWAMETRRASGGLPAPMLASALPSPTPLGLVKVLRSGPGFPPCTHPTGPAATPRAGSATGDRNGGKSTIRGSSFSLKRPRRICGGVDEGEGAGDRAGKGRGKRLTLAGPDPADPTGLVQVRVIYPTTAPIETTSSQSASAEATIATAIAATATATVSETATAATGSCTLGPSGSRKKKTRHGGSTAVADKARMCWSLLALELLSGHSGDDVATAGRIADLVRTLESNRLVRDARGSGVGNGDAAHALLLLKMTGAEAKPVLRMLYGQVGQVGKEALGLPTAADVFKEMGYDFMHQNKVRSVSDALAHAPALPHSDEDE